MKLTDRLGQAWGFAVFFSSIMGAFDHVMARLGRLFQVSREASGGVPTWVKLYYNGNGNL